jgi:hypothetical protein
VATRCQGFGLRVSSTLLAMELDKVKKAHLFTSIGLRPTRFRIIKTLTVKGSHRYSETSVFIGFH